MEEESDEIQDKLQHVIFQLGKDVADHQYGRSRSDSSYVETGSSYCRARPAASTAIPKSPVLIPVSMNEIVQTLNLPQFRATYQVVVSRHVNVETGFNSRPFHVGFSVYKVETREVRHREGRCPLITIFSTRSTHIFHSSTITDAI
jgi:hypothetical protein